MQKIAGILKESSNPTFDQIAMNHSNTGDQIAPGATKGQTPMEEDSPWDEDRDIHDELMLSKEGQALMDNVMSLMRQKYSIEDIVDFIETSAEHADLSFGDQQSQKSRSAKRRRSKYYDQ
jgi:hypothetical protein